MANYPPLTASSPLNMSYPSTTITTVGDNKVKLAGPKDIGLAAIRTAAMDPTVHDLLFPPDGSYPHAEWQDITDDLRAAYGAMWMGVALRQEGYDAKDIDQKVLEKQLRSILSFADLTQFPEYDTVESYKAMIRDFALQAIREHTALKQGSKNPIPAREGHLMAYGNQLARAKAMMRDGSAMQRKVQFDEPVNAWTCLHGDKLAHGGDMLTAVTVTDTQPFEIKDFRGQPKIVHQSKAVTM